MRQLTKAEVVIKAFRAVDSPDLCQRFIEGHEKVLESIGVKKVTSSNHYWKDNPASYVILCLNKDLTKAYGGARIHVQGGNQELPLVEGVAEKQPNINDFVNEEKPLGTGEFCGLWNSMEVAGMGIGALYVVRSAVAITTQLGIKSCFALCSPMGARIALKFGYQLRKDIGNDGTFYYPKEDLIATMMFLPDVKTLETCPEVERQKILELRENPNLHIVEESRGKTIDIQYDLEITNVDKSVFDWGI